MQLSSQEAYRIFFPQYSDVVGINEMCEMLGGISKKAGYKLLHNGEVASFRLGKEYKIPKMNIIAYLQKNITAN